MATTIIKNNAGVTRQWVGYELTVGQALAISSDNAKVMSKDELSVIDISNGVLIINDGMKDLSPIEAIEHLTGGLTHVTISQTSELGDKKIWVHQSPKPEIDGRQFYAVWAGSSDDMAERVISNGEPIIIENTPGVPKKIHEFEFLHEYGDVYIHEAYFMWADAGFGDNFSTEIHAKPTLLQTMVNLNLIVENHCIKFSPSGLGTGTHGFAAPPVLIRKVDYSGHWDYSPATGLVPNIEGKGFFDIFDIGLHVNTFMSRIPVYGTSHSYNVFKSSDTAYLPPGYYIKVTTENVSNTNWKLFMVAALFRETTV